MRAYTGPRADGAVARGLGVVGALPDGCGREAVV